MKPIDEKALVYRVPGSLDVGVYLGSMDELEKVPVCWHQDETGDYLTFEEIRKQIRQKTDYPLITVIVNTPLHCAIYQCGNYAENEWWWLGDVAGYA